MFIPEPPNRRREFRRQVKQEARKTNPARREAAKVEAVQRMRAATVKVAAIVAANPAVAATRRSLAQAAAAALIATDQGDKCLTICSNATSPVAVTCILCTSKTSSSV